MTSPLLALRAAIRNRLAGDAALAALMGGSVRVYDEPPAGAAPVHAVFGPSEARNDSVDGVVSLRSFRFLRQACSHSQRRLFRMARNRPGNGLKTVARRHFTDASAPRLTVGIVHPTRRAAVVAVGQHWALVPSLRRYRSRAAREPRSLICRTGDVAFMLYKCKTASMGRRKATENTALAERVRAACVDGRASLSKIAQDIEVSPSTLTRAMNSQRFSRKLQFELGRYLGRDASSEQPANAALIGSLQKMLQILMELQNLMPDLQERLEAALDPQKQLRQTAE